MSEAEGNGSGAGIFRRWIDRAFIAAVGIAIALIGFVYTGLAGSDDRMDSDQRVHAERIRAVEQSASEVLRRLDRIESKVDMIGEKQK